ncbi:MAG: hormogonium polysaccharide biosynthesis acetyltransferase HpsU [Cyanobacteria bacterium P01_H01_bin.15]
MGQSPSPTDPALAWTDLRNYDQSWYDRGRPGWYVLLWWFVQSVAFPLSLHSFDGLRCWLLRKFGAQIGQGVKIRPTARFTYPWKVTLGSYSWVGDDVVFYSLEQIHIGSHCVISQKSYLCTGSHDYQDPTFGLITAPIVVGSGAWVATDVFVGPGVTIGVNAVIGARSSVFKDIGPGRLAYGSPARDRGAREMNPGKE